MYRPYIINKSQIPYCGITIIRRVRKIVQTSVSARGENDLKRHGVLIFATRGRDSTHLFQRVSEGSGIGSPHWTAILESSCKMTLTGRRKRPRKPRGSYRELTVEWMPRLVAVFLLRGRRWTQWKVSEASSQCNPSARPTWSWLRLINGLVRWPCGRTCRSAITCELH